MPELGLRDLEGRVEPRRLRPRSNGSTSSARGAAEIAARAALTRPRSSRNLRSAARPSASRESSGNPLVISRRLNCRAGVAISSASSTGLPSATRASKRVRE